MDETDNDLFALTTKGCVQLCRHTEIPLRTFAINKIFSASWKRVRLWPRLLLPTFDSVSAVAELFTPDSKWCAPRLSAAAGLRSKDASIYSIKAVSEKSLRAINNFAAI